MQCSRFQALGQYTSNQLHKIPNAVTGEGVQVHQRLQCQSLFDVSELAQLGKADVRGSEKNGCHYTAALICVTENGGQDPPVLLCDPSGLSTSGPDGSSGYGLNCYLR